MTVGEAEVDVAVAVFDDDAEIDGYDDLEGYAEFDGFDEGDGTDEGEGINDLAGYAVIESIADLVAITDDGGFVRCRDGTTENDVDTVIVGQIIAAQFAVEDPGTLAQLRTAVWHVSKDMSQHVGEGAREGAGEQAIPPVAPAGPHGAPPFWPRAAVENSSVNRVRNILLLIGIEIFLVSQLPRQLLVLYPLYKDFSDKY